LKKVFWTESRKSARMQITVGMRMMIGMGFARQGDGSSIGRAEWPSLLLEGVIGGDVGGDESGVWGQQSLSGGWQHPETVPNLEHNELHIWRVEPGRAGSSLQEINGLLRQSYAVLTGEERERAARMRAGNPREEFVVGRGCVRRLLGAQLEIDPRAVAIESGQHGKPRLRVGRLAFNVAHSRGVVLIALAGGGDVGVDVEFVDARVELLDVARSAFHPGDLARIEGAATQDARLTEFYRCWTRREAVAKADGRGLSIGPEEFCAGDGEDEVTVAVGEKSYFVRGIKVGSAHLAAVATTFSPAEIRCFDLSMGSPLLYAE
jgi:4'-phosphopantetheinyl transferase